MADPNYSSLPNATPLDNQSRLHRHPDPPQTQKLLPEYTKPAQVCAALSELSQAACIFAPVLVLTSLVFASLFMLMPLSTQILIEQVCREINDGRDCDSSDVSSRAGLIAMGAVLAQGVPSFLFTGTYGLLSDIYGRKYVMLIPVVGMAVYAGGLLIVQTYEPSFYIAIAIGSAFLNGCTGGILVFIMAAYAYVSDLTRTAVSLRRSAFSLTHACMMGPKIFAPVGTGILAHRYGFTCPLYLLLGVLCIAILWVLFIPESLPLGAPSRRKHFRVNLLQTVHNIKLLLSYEGGVSGRSPVPHIALAFLLYCVCIMANILISILYVKHKFNWSPETLGYYEGLDGSIDTLSMLFAPAILQCFINMDMMEWLQLGFFIRAVFWLLVSLATDTTMMFALLPLLLLSGPIIPYTKTLLSNSVPHELQARVFSGLSGAECLAGLVGPVFSVCYSVSVKYGHPGLTYQFMAGLATCALVIVSYVLCSPELKANLPKNDKYEGEDALRDDESCYTTSVDYTQQSPLLSIDESIEYEFDPKPDLWSVSNKRRGDAILDGAYGARYDIDNSDVASRSVDAIGECHL